MSDSVRPHRRQPTRLPRPWDSPGKNTEVGCHFLLQCVKVKSESDPSSCGFGPLDPQLPSWGVLGEEMRGEVSSAAPVPQSVCQPLRPSRGSGSVLGTHEHFPHHSTLLSFDWLHSGLGSATVIARLPLTAPHWQPHSWVQWKDVTPPDSSSQTPGP